MYLHQVVPSNEIPKEAAHESEILRCSIGATERGCHFDQ